MPDRDPGEAGEEVDVPEVYIVEDNGDLQPGITFSCQVRVTAQYLCDPTPHTVTCSQISVLEASGLPKEYCHYVFCQYQFWNEENPLIIPPLVQSGQEKVTDRLQRFEHCQVGGVGVTSH